MTDIEEPTTFQAAISRMNTRLAAEREAREAKRAVRNFHKAVCEISPHLAYCLGDSLTSVGISLATLAITDPTEWAASVRYLTEQYPSVSQAEALRVADSATVHFAALLNPERQ